MTTPLTCGANITLTRRQQRFLNQYGPAALVTGASSGVGREIAHRLAEGGFDLVLVARREAELHELAAELTDRHGVEVRVLPLDLARPGSLDRLASATAGSDIGLCVAAAGFGTSGPLIESSLPRELEMVEVNCAAVLTLGWLFGRRLADRGRGRAHPAQLYRRFPGRAQRGPLRRDEGVRADARRRAARRTQAARGGCARRDAETRPCPN